MPNLTVEFNADAAEQAMKQWPGRVSRATMRALNRTLVTGRAEMARRVAKDIGGMKIAEAKEAILMDQAKPDRLSVRLVASKRRRPLKDFGARQVAAGVTFAGKGGVRQLVPGAFLSGVETGHVGTRHAGVFKRVPGANRRGPAPNRSQLPIYELYGVSIGHVFEQHRAAVLEVMRQAFEKNLDHELEFAKTEHA